MQLGPIVFEVGGAEYSEIQRRAARRWERRARYGKPPLLEDGGREHETINLRGTVFVTTHRTLTALDEMRAQAGLTGTAAAAPLTMLLRGGGSAQSGGMWVVREMVTTGRQLRTMMGIPTTIEFELTLEEYVG